ncbi:disulfide bond formation protein DsbB [Halopelagius inordinatus]|uniref:Disulfide bond formation protein DsbB n=1 Tax=Halopelagius inordinatus TaxID=553467 RepID=A0A1I2R2H1_9EURY|nr:disulfide bond formation protein B [Halopelagius inordinatus]SFG34864.1 disulfide bond formation protein DsbB [Halopelagius inordinatus]
MSTRRTRVVLAAATAVAAVATAGSLYFSLGLGLVPCDLCWYQRILMYPLVVVLGVAAVERRRTVFWTVLPLSALGVVVSSYHVYLQVAPGGGTCSLGGGCASIQYAMLGGLLTIPRLSLLAFLLITGLAATLALTREDAWAANARRSIS